MPPGASLDGGRATIPALDDERAILDDDDGAALDKETTRLFEETSPTSFESVLLSSSESKVRILLHFWEPFFGSIEKDRTSFLQIC